jgi:hypothetical protein
MPEGLSPGEADKEVSEHAPSGRRGEDRGADRVVVIDGRWPLPSRG